jgi:hypothetical protein
LLYITLGTRPNIAFSTIKLSRFSLNPFKEYIDLALNILKYLKITKDLSITYTTFPNIVSAYYNADYVGDNYTTKSILGYVIYLANRPIS